MAKLKYFGNETLIENEKPYAELWMGTHPSGPAKVVIDDTEDTQYLSDYLKLNPYVFTNLQCHCFISLTSFYYTIIIH